MSNCPTCGKVYTDDDCEQDDASVKQSERGTCKHCTHWGTEDEWNCKRRCIQLLRGGNGFMDDMSAGDGGVLITSPTFSCAMFKFKGKKHDHKT